jgi:hypothetical protein
VLFGVAMFFMFANAAPALNFVMRCLPPEHVSLGISTMQVIWKLTGSVPGPIIMGALFDAQCAFTEASCTASSCVLFHNPQLSKAYTLLAIICKVLATASFGLAWLAFVKYHKGQPARGPVAVNVEMIPSQQSLTYKLPIADPCSVAFMIDNPNMVPNALATPPPSK